MKYFLLTSLILFCGCAELQPSSQVNSKKVVFPTESAGREPNEKCQSDIQEVEIFQVFDDGALANVCETGTRACFGMIVAIAKEQGEDFWDKKRVKAPKDKCMVVNGTYKYTSNDNRNRTVPVIRYDYKYLPASADEIMERVEVALSPMKQACIDESMKMANVDRQKNSELCDCFVVSMKEVAIDLVSNSIKLESDTFIKKWIKDSEKKCGNSPKDMKWFL